MDLVIRLPKPSLKSLISLRSLFFFALALCVGASFYWYREVRPYLNVPLAHVGVYTVNLSSEFAGRMVEMGPGVGETVQKGQILFAIDRDFTKAKQKQLEVRLDALRQVIQTEKQRMDRSMQQYLLASSDTNGSSETIVKSLAALEDAQAKSEAASSGLPSLEAEMALLDLQVKKMAVEAPFDGLVLKRAKNKGESISVGETIYTLSDPKDFWVEADIPEKELQGVAVGTPAWVYFSAYPKEPVKGQVSQISPLAADDSSIQIKIALEQSDVKLKSGLTARARLKVR
jgi:RND family efflux transporter MFP subunit